MSRSVILSLSALLVAGTAAAQTPPPAPAAPATAPSPSSTPPARVHPTFESTLGELAADPVTKAILEKHLPNFTSNESFGVISRFTLTQFGEMVQGGFPQEKLAAIETDLKALAAP